MNIRYILKIVFSVFVFSLCSAFLVISCNFPSVPLPSVVDGGDDDDDEPVVRSCASRDSCEDICDDIFDSTSERFQCYDMSYREVSTLAKVADVLLDDDIDLNDLEDIDSDDLRSYVEIGSATLVKIAEGEGVGYNDEAWGDTRAARKDNSEVILQWIAENEDVSEVFVESEDMLDFGIELFNSIGATLANVAAFERDKFCSNDATCLKLTDVVNRGISVEVKNSEQGVFLRDLDLGSDELWGQAWYQFMEAEPENFGTDRFMSYAIDEENDQAIQYGHSILVELCKNMTDENEDEVEVKQCLQATYCQYDVFGGDMWSFADGIFDDLENYDDIVGRTKNDRCDDLHDEDRIDNLF